MRSLFILLVAVAIGNCQRSKRNTGGWGTSLATARINSQEMRLNELNKQLDGLEAAISAGDDSLPASMDSLSLRLNKIEGDDCGARKYTCGRHSGECVFQLMVCDGVEDCANGADEIEEICKNPVPAGRSWRGVANWNSCLVRSNNNVNLLITGNKRINHFPSQLYLNAMVYETYTQAGEEMSSTWTMEGSYNFATRTIELNPPKNSEMGLSMVCVDAGDKVAKCDFIRVTDRFSCGSVTMTREG